MVKYAGGVSQANLFGHLVLLLAVEFHRKGLSFILYHMILIYILILFTPNVFQLEDTVRLLGTLLLLDPYISQKVSRVL